MMTMRFGGYQPDRSVHTRSVREFGDVLAKRLGPGLEFQFTSNIMATGRAAADLLSLTETGELDACYFASSYLAQRVPELTVLDLPFAGGDRATIWSKLDGPAGARIKAAVQARTGYVVLGFWDNGIRHVSNGTRPIRHPRDCTGLSIRTLDNTFHQAIFRALGFEPRYLDVSELGPAVRNRTIDAQENPLTNIVNFDIHKTHRHVSLLGQFFGIALLLANRKTLEGWTGDTRAAVHEATVVATATQRRLAAEEDEQCLALLEADGVDVVSTEAIDLDAFRVAVADVVAREAASIDPELLALWRS